MRRLVLNPTARKDLGETLRYLARQSGSTRVARNFTSILRAQCRHLASLPGTLGRSRPDLGIGVRSFACRGYVIVFCYEPGVFRVLAIIEGYLDYNASLIDLPDGTTSK